jgi:hypothetical protein
MPVTKKRSSDELSVINAFSKTYSETNIETLGRRDFSNGFDSNSSVRDSASELAKKVTCVHFRDYC